MHRLTTHSLMTLAGLLVSLRAQAQEPFNGLVFNQDSVPIAKVKVSVLGKRGITKTDRQGRFGLSDVAPTDTIVLRYKKEEYHIAVKGRKSLKVSWNLEHRKADSWESQDLVDQGYGFVSRRLQTGVSSGISGEMLRRTGRNNLIDALQGKVAGLNIVDGEIRIRGAKSFMADCTPLFVVDGTIVSSLDDINVYDVDYVEVLKDASIYGSRGANGAILVRTLKAGPARKDLR